jgi:hypothetical protein
VAVDHVRRNADALERALDIGFDRLQACHGPRVCAKGPSAVKRTNRGLGMFKRGLCEE